MTEPEKKLILGEVLIAVSLAAISFSVDVEPVKTLATLAAGVGGDWIASLAERGTRNLLTRLFNGKGETSYAVTSALRTSLKKAIHELEKDWKQQAYYRHLLLIDPEKAELCLSPYKLIEKNIDNFFNDPDLLKDLIQNNDVIALIHEDIDACQIALENTIRSYLYDHDPEVVNFIKKHLVDEWLIQFRRLISSNKDQGVKAWQELVRLHLLSLVDATQEIREETIKISAVIDRLNSWMEQIPNDSNELNRSSEYETILNRLIEQASITVAPKPKIFIGTVWPPLQVFRERVVQYFRGIGYRVVSEEVESQWSSSRKLSLINDCDLFIGVYANENGAVPDAPSDSQRSIIFDEIQTARKTFRRCLIFVASTQQGSDIPILTEPPKPIFADLPTLRLFEYPEPVSKPVPGWGSKLLEWKARLFNKQTQQELYEEYEKKCYLVGEENRKRKEKHDRKTYEYHNHNAKKQELYDQEMQIYQTQKDIQQSFLDTEIAGYFIHRFSSSSDLEWCIETDHNLIQQEKISGFSKFAVINQWKDKVVDWRQAIKEVLPYNPPLELKSPVQEHLDKFLSQEWYQRVETLASNVVFTAESINLNSVDESIENEIMLLISLFFKLPIDPQKENYLTITRQFREWCERAITSVNDVQNVVSQRRREGKIDYESSNRIDQQVKEWKDSVSKLNEFFDTSSYGKCLSIIGTAGSGKTYFVDRLLHESGKPLEKGTPFYLYISPDISFIVEKDRDNIEKIVLESARFVSANQYEGPVWRSIEEFSNFVFNISENPGHVIIVFDDLHRWIREYGLDLENLQRFIEHCTRFHNLHWIFCLNEANYDLISLPKYERFWAKYGFSDYQHTAAPEGWISLDYLNKVTAQWKNIIEYELKAKNIDSPVEITKALGDYDRDLLYNPFIAWVFIKAFDNWFQNYQELLNLNYINFVTEFWKKRLDQLLLYVDKATEKFSLLEPFYWRVTYLIAGIVILKRQTRFNKLKLIRELESINEEKMQNFNQFVPLLLSKLEEAGLLKDPEKFTPRLKGKLGDQLSIEFQPFWQWQSGDFLIDYVSENTQSITIDLEKIKLFFSEIWDRSYLSGVVEYLLLLIDQRIFQESNFPIDFTMKLFSNLEPFQAELWLSASKASPRYQNTLAKWFLNNQFGSDQPSVIDGSTVIWNDETLHRFLFFLKYAEKSNDPDSGLTPVHRMKLLQPHFAKIRKGNYFKSFLDSLIENETNGSDIARSFAYLYGIEDVLNDETYWANKQELAYWTYEKLCTFDSTNENNRPSIILHTIMMDFLAEVSIINPEKTFDTHWALLTRYYCDDLSHNLSLDLLIWLEKNGWFFNSGSYNPITKKIRNTMEAILTTASGVRYREHTLRVPQEDYETAVEQWAKETYFHKRIAFYLIKHTIPSEGEYSNRPVTSRLRKILKNLSEDPDPKLQQLLNLQNNKIWLDHQFENQGSR